MSNHDEKIQHFIGVTGVDIDRAATFLESANGNLEIAISNFYETEEIESNGADSDVEIVEQNTAPQAASNDVPPQQKPKSVKKANSRFATIHTLNNSPSSDEEEEGQAFYAGGSEHSGQQVLGPKKRDLAAEMMRTVREHGIEMPADFDGASGSRAFQGTGYRLGQSDNDSVPIPGAAQPSRPKRVTLKLWREGFSVDDGDLRYYTEASNQDFLNSIRRGEIPMELRTGSSEVDVIMEDHRGESYQAPGGSSRSRRVFTGQGHTLGSPTPPVVGAPMAEDKTVNEANAKEHLKVDTSQPTTNLQIRLADGSRLVAQFNHTNTIGEIRTYIVNARPQYQTRSFQLLSAFPTRELTDSQTIVEADLLNAAIIQKLT